MSDDTFDARAWLRRIGYDGLREPTLATLRAVISAQTGTIPFENIDVLLGRTPGLDLGSLQRKMIAAGRGGYCFELNALLRAGLLSLGFNVTGLIARVIRGMEIDAAEPAAHMILRVDLPDGPFLADAGFGNQTPTGPLALRADIEQATPHEPMRLIPVGDELALQAKPGAQWQNIYRLSQRPALDVDYKVANWFTATHPASPFVSHLIVARPGADRARQTLFNGRLTTRQPPDRVERRMLEDEASLATVLRDTFGLTVSGEDLTATLAVLDRKGTRGTTQPFFS
ncbi:MAG: arylamine N-acetyltransferase [Acetobacteraceae bacterium]|nr:arylamine N-acetyltransferase [Acetobacteraceae bacterium]